LNNKIKADLIHFKIQIKLTNNLTVVNQMIFGPNSINLNRILIINNNRIIIKIERNMIMSIIQNNNLKQQKTNWVLILILVLLLKKQQTKLGYSILINLTSGVLMK
jgi:hypothetical protein